MNVSGMLPEIPSSYFSLLYLSNQPIKVKMEYQHRLWELALHNLMVYATALEIATPHIQFEQVSLAIHRHSAAGDLNATSDSPNTFSSKDEPGSDI